MLSRFHLILDRQIVTDRQTDRQNCYINIARQHSVSVLTRDKNCVMHTGNLRSNCMTCQVAITVLYIITV